MYFYRHAPGIVMDERMRRVLASGQLAWGILLVLAGIGVFVRIPTALERLRELPAFQSAGAALFMKISFFLMGVILLGGGIKKIAAQYRIAKGGEAEPPQDTDA